MADYLQKFHFPIQIFIITYYFWCWNSSSNIYNTIKSTKRFKVVPEYTSYICIWMQSPSVLNHSLISKHSWHLRGGTWPATCQTSWFTATIRGDDQRLTPQYGQLQIRGVAHRLTTSSIYSYTADVLGQYNSVMLYVNGDNVCKTQFLKDLIITQPTCIYNSIKMHPLDLHQCAAVKNLMTNQINADWIKLYLVCHNNYLLLLTWLILYITKLFWQIGL